MFVSYVSNVTYQNDAIMLSTTRRKSIFPLEDAAHTYQNVRAPPKRWCVRHTH
jgi:hypothetical protein